MRTALESLSPFLVYNRANPSACSRASSTQAFPTHEPGMPRAEAQERTVAGLCCQRRAEVRDVLSVVQGSDCGSLGDSSHRPGPGAERSGAMGWEEEDKTRDGT